MSLASADRFRTLARNRDLGLLLAAGTVSETGDWILGTGSAFEVYALTRSTVATAALLVAMQLPLALLGSAAGVLVDRWDRRRVMVLVNGVLAVTLLPLLAVRDGGQVWIVLAVVAVSACLSPFVLAAEASLLPALVPERLLVTMNAANGQLRNVSRLLGAALGGVLVAAGGFAALAVADVTTFLVACALISLVRHRPEVVARVSIHPLEEWVDGLTAIRRSRALSVVLVVFALTGAGEGILGTLFAPFVSDVLGGRGAAYGGVLAAQALGGIVGGLAVTAFGHRFAPRILFGGGAVLFGLLDLVLFLLPLAVPEVWPAAVVIALVGLPAAAFSAGMLSVFQIAAPAAVRGRVFGSLTAVQNLTMLGGTAIAGVAASGVGIVPLLVLQGLVYVFAGIITLVALRGTAEAPGITRPA